MEFIQESQKPIYLDLQRDLTKLIKQGHPWLYRSAFKDLPETPAGAIALIRYKNKVIATGYYSPSSALAVRVCTQDGVRLDDKWAHQQLERALKNRKSFEDSQTNAFRLINGEGDGLPGLTCDIYNQHAVVQLDGHAPAHFWNTKSIAQWITKNLPIINVIEKNRESQDKNLPLIGTLPDKPISFTEHGLNFQADIVNGQKTGFFLDQRENRHLIKRFSEGRSVLNLFSYTGGFSIYAGAGGASEVTSVDIARPATLEAQANWQLNQLSAEHHALSANVFDFLDENKGRQTWDLVIVDPPSFAPSNKSTDKALQSYKTIFTKAINVTSASGLIALSSCSSHIDFPTFLGLCENALSTAHRRGHVLCTQGQPHDHPFPIILKEYRYLKFVLIQLTN